MNINNVKSNQTEMSELLSSRRRRRRRNDVDDNGDDFTIRICGCLNFNPFLFLIRTSN